MLYKTRRKLFWILVVLFIIVGSIAVVYSFGYRFDSKNWQFTQTGGLYLETYPKILNINIDDELLEKKSSLLNSGIFIQSLVPEEHLLEIYKDGYYSWSKNIKIKPQMVVSFAHISLLPETPDRRSLYETEEGESLVDFKAFEKYYLIESKLKTTSGYFQILKLINLNGEIKEVFRKKINSRDKVNVLREISVNEETKKILIPFRINGSMNGTIYLWDELEDEPLVDFSSIVNKYFPFEIKKIMFHPFNQNQYLIQTKERLGVLDLDKKEATYLPAEKMVNFTVSKNFLFWVDDLESVYSYNFISKNVSLLNELEEGDLEDIQILSSLNSRHIAFLFKSGTLVLVSMDSGVRVLSDDVIQFNFSPDSRKLAYLKKSTKDDSLEARIYFLKNAEELEKNIGDEVEFKFKSSLKDFTGFKWLSDSFHLVASFITGQTVFFEIDDRDKINYFEYNFEPGGFVLTDSGLIFRVTTELVEKINILVEGI